jgi:hypothetical protein
MPSCLHVSASSPGPQYGFIDNGVFREQWFAAVLEDRSNRICRLVFKTETVELGRRNGP